MKSLRNLMLVALCFASVGVAEAHPWEWEYLVVSAALSHRNLEQMLNARGGGVGVGGVDEEGCGDFEAGALKGSALTKHRYILGGSRCPIATGDWNDRARRAR